MLLAGLPVLKGKRNLAVAHNISFDFAGECASVPLLLSYFVTRPVLKLHYSWQLQLKTLWPIRPSVKRQW